MRKPPHFESSGLALRKMLKQAIAFFFISGGDRPWL
jgi:hypothetical protein